MLVLEWTGPGAGSEPQPWPEHRPLDPIAVDTFDAMARPDALFVGVCYGRAGRSTAAWGTREAPWGGVKGHGCAGPTVTWTVGWR